PTSSRGCSRRNRFPPPERRPGSRSAGRSQPFTRGGCPILGTGPIMPVVRSPIPFLEPPTMEATMLLIARSALPPLFLVALFALGPVAAGPARAGVMKSESPGNNWVVTSDDQTPEFAYVLVRENTSSVSGSGEGDDFDDARRLRSRIGSDFLWA